MALYKPRLREVGPVGHYHGTEHHVVLGEVAGKEVGGPHHGDPEHVGDLVSVGRVGPLRPRLRLTVVVEGVEVDRRLELCVQLGSGDGRGHPLMVREERQQGLPTHVAVVPVGPVGVHEFDGFPQDVFTWRERIMDMRMHCA